MFDFSAMVGRIFKNAHNEKENLRVYGVYFYEGETRVIVSNTAGGNLYVTNIENLKVPNAEA